MTRATLHGKKATQFFASLHDNWTQQRCLERYQNLTQERVARVFDLLEQLTCVEIMMFTVMLGDTNFMEMGPFELFGDFFLQITTRQSHTLNQGTAGRTEVTERLIRVITGRAGVQIYHQRLERVRKQFGAGERLQAATMKVTIQFIQANAISDACRIHEISQHHGGMSSILQACLKSGGNWPEFKKAYPDIAVVLIGLVETLASPNLPLSPFLRNSYALNSLSKIYGTVQAFKNQSARISAADEHAVFSPPMVIEERIANTALTMSWRQSRDFRHQPLRHFTSRVHKVRSKPDTCAPCSGTSTQPHTCGSKLSHLDTLMWPRSSISKLGLNSLKI